MRIMRTTVTTSAIACRVDGRAFQGRTAKPTLLLNVGVGALSIGPESDLT
jgi:hypothetical protein